MIDSFELMGHRITVKYGRVPREAWAWYRDDDKVIVLSPRIKKQPISHLHHTLWHEITHAILAHIGFVIQRDLSSADHCAARHQIRFHFPTPVGLIIRFSRKPSIVRFHV